MIKYQQKKQGSYFDLYMNMFMSSMRPQAHGTESQLARRTKLAVWEQSPDSADSTRPKWASLAGSPCPLALAGQHTAWSSSGLALPGLPDASGVCPPMCAEG